MARVTRYRRGCLVGVVLLLAALIGPRLLRPALQPADAFTVVRVAPVDGETNVDLTAHVTVVFDQPVITPEALIASAQDPRHQRDLPQPLRLTAEPDASLTGTGRWLSPTVYSFLPATGLHAATTYTAQVRDDVPLIGSFHLGSSHVWRFTTRATLPVSARPINGAVDVARDSVVELLLPDGVTPSAAATLLQVSQTGDDTPLPGSIVQREHSLIFTPATLLTSGTTYELRLLPGLTTPTGQPLQYEPLVSRFTIVNDLAVARVAPLDGDRDVGLDSRISATFQRPVVQLPNIDDQAGLPQPLDITPSLSGSGRWVAPDTYVYSPTVPLQPNTRYIATLAAGLRDTSGTELRTPHRWSFSTLTPGVLKTDFGVIQPNGTFVPELGSDVYPEHVFSITFNAPIDADTLQNAISLERKDTATPVASKVTVQSTTALFIPTTPLERGTTYTLRIAPTVRLAQSSATLGTLYEKEFETLARPTLDTTTPGDGETDVVPGPVATGGASVDLNFNVPMNEDSVRNNLTISPPTQVLTITSVGKSVRFDVNLEPERDYQITVDAAAQDIYGVPLGRNFTFGFRTAKPSPTLAIARQLLPDFNKNTPVFEGAQLTLSNIQGIGTFSAYNPARIALRYVNVPNVSYDIYRVTSTQVISLTGDSDARKETFQPEQTALLKQAAYQLNGQPNKQWLDVLNLGTLDPGLYYLRVRGPNSLGDNQIMVVSRYAMTIKYSEEQLFVWVVDLATGSPVPNLPLTASFRQGNTLATHALGRTDADGVLQISLVAAHLRFGRSLFIWSEMAGQFAFATTSWDRDLTEPEYSIHRIRDQVMGNVYSDRPLYRPEQTVYIRGVVRFDRNGVYHLPTMGQHVRITINDPRGTTVYSTSLPLNETGSYSTSLQLDQFTPLGTYAMYGQVEDEPLPKNGTTYSKVRSLDNSSVQESLTIPSHHFFGVFIVAEYRRPTFRVDVSPDQVSVLPNTTLTFTVTARTFSGEPIANAPVRWSLISAPLDFAAGSAGEFHFGQIEEVDHYVGPQVSPSAGGTTNAQGQFIIQRGIYSSSTTNRREVLHVEVTDFVGRTVNFGQAIVTVNPGAFYVGVRPASWVARIGETVPVDLVTLDPAGNPAAKRSLTLRVIKRDFFSVREQGSEGRFYWTSTFSDTLLTSSAASTDAGGHAQIPFVPSTAGTYILAAEGYDDTGNLIRASVRVAVSGQGVFWGIDDTNRIQLLADRDSYHPGDTARILVPAPYKGMTALLTIERGAVLEHRRLVLSDTTGLLDIPIRSEYTPNVYVAVTLIKPSGAELSVPELRVGAVELKVPIEQQLLHIVVTPDKPKAGPREQVTFTIKATDWTGKGVRTELTLALVDDALLALVKSLARDPTPTYTQNFFGRRVRGVITANTLVQLIDRVALRVQPGSKGGAGGGTGGGDIPGISMLDDLLLRRNFPDTAYWNPSLMTDDDGSAQVTVELPDTVTTWRMVVRGLTSDTRFGQAVGEVQVSRPLFIEPLLPVALLVGDHAILRALVRNTTDKPVATMVRLTSNGLPIIGETQHTLTLAGGELQVVTWEVEAQAEAHARLQFTARGENGQRDDVEVMLPIRRYTLSNGVVSAGQVYDTTTATISLPTTPISNAHYTLILDIASSLTAAITAAQHMFVPRTNENIEQSVSGVLTVLAASSTSARGSDPSVLVRLQQIAHLQHPDGGWGWWSQDLLSDPFLSAYAVQGLVAARKAGYSVDAGLFDRSVANLETLLNDFSLDLDDDAPWHGTARCYVLYVLAEAGRGDLNQALALYDQRERLGIGGRAYLLLALDTLGDTSGSVLTLANELAERTTPRPDDVFWRERVLDAETLSSDTQTTALVTLGLLRANPQHVLIPDAVRYLMGQRVGEGWRSTYETALAAQALAAYQAHSGTSSRYTYQVILDERPLLNGAASDAATQPITATVALSKTLTPLRLTIERQPNWVRQAVGPLYYRVQLRLETGTGDVAPLDQGVQLSRTYLAVEPQTLASSNKPVQEATLSDLVMVKLTVTLPQTAHYLVVEDALPAGLEPLALLPRSGNALLAAPPPDPSLPATALEQFTNVSFYRDRVVLFATTMTPGTTTYTYLARAVVPGSFQAPPTVAYQMYTSAIAGHSAGARFSVRSPAAMVTIVP